MATPDTPRPAKPYLHVSGGNPAGYPDFVPLNPWGRGFPKVERPGPRHELYQVIVRDKRDGNKVLRVGPKMAQEFAEMMCDAIKKQIASGAERRWLDPVAVQMV